MSRPLTTQIEVTKRRGVLLVANYGSDVGYAWWLMESYWAALARHYAPHEDVYLAYPRVALIPAAVSEAPLKVVQMDFGQPGFRALLDQWRWLRKHHIDAVYLTDWDSTSLRFIMFRLAGVRTIVVHDHTPGRRTPASGLRGELKKAVHMVGLWRASAMIGASEFVTERHRAVNRFPHSRCWTVPNGLPPNEPPEPLDIYSTWHIPVGRTVIVGVGRASRIKDIATAIRALAILVVERGLKDVHYLHLGDGPELEKLQSLSEELGVRAHVSLPGRMSQVNAALLSSHIFIHPSRGEVGFSLAILESMRAGLPTVVSDDESVRGATVHEETGLWFQMGNPQSAADALERLVRDPELRLTLGKAAALTQRNKYDLRVSHDRLVTAFEAIRGRES